MNVKTKHLLQVFSDSPHNWLLSKPPKLVLIKAMNISVRNGITRKVLMYFLVV